MRIVSQDREFDTPYAKVLLYVLKRSEKYHIFVSFGFDETYDYSIGAYKTKERCLEVMQEIREAAAGIPFIQNPVDVDIEKMKNELKHAPIMVANCGSASVWPGEAYFYMPEE